MNESRKEITQIIRELESYLRLRHFMVEDVVAWWNSQIVEFGFVSVADLLELFMTMRAIDEMEIKPEYHKYGFVRHIGETINFKPKRSISGVWKFQPEFPQITKL
jgi:hypothetical protein